MRRESARGRLITVDGVTCRWSVRGRRKWSGEDYRVLTLVDDEKTGQVVQVMVRHDDIWLNYGTLLTAHARGVAHGLTTRSLTPGLVARVIRLAREQGWIASQRGPTLQFVFVDDQRLVPLKQWEGSALAPEARRG